MKNLDYYMSLEYKVEIITIPEEVGGGVVARIPKLGKYAFLGDGETIEEAMDNLNNIKRELFTSYLKLGIEIPEP